MEKRAYTGGGAESESNARFGPFELDLRRGELRKEGRRIRLQDQARNLLSHRHLGWTRSGTPVHIDERFAAADLHISSVSLSRISCLATPAPES